MTDWLQTLRGEFAEYDCARAAKRLAWLHAQWADEAPRSIEAAQLLVPLCADADGNTQIGASWLLRARLEELAAAGVAVGDAIIGELATVLPAIHEAWARQHVCQCLAVLEIPAPLAPAFARFLRAAADAEPKFLRAWGVDGFVRLGWQHAEYAREAETCLARAESDDAASVRARARNLRRDQERRARSG